MSYTRLRRKILCEHLGARTKPINSHLSCCTSIYTDPSDSHYLRRVGPGRVIYARPVSECADGRIGVAAVGGQWKLRNVGERDQREGKWMLVGPVQGFRIY